jgi:hypothetical protein
MTKEDLKTIENSKKIVKEKIGEREKRTPRKSNYSRKNTT